MAHGSLLGISHRRFLHSRDLVERLVEQSVVVRASELAEVRDSNLAVKIANNLGKVLGG